jgi:sugar/nucleoside kinase (ribokinase family)
VFDVLTVGDVMLDVRVSADALVPGGDVAGRVRVRPAGTSANAAVWAAATGARAVVCARVGDDLTGRLLAEALEGAGVRALLTVDPSAETGTMLVVTTKGERSMVADRGANARITPADLPQRLSAGAVLVSGYLACDPRTAPVARAAIERAAAPHIAVDAGSWPLLEAIGPEAFFRATAGATLVFANEREATALTGRDAEDAAEVLGRHYGAAVVKLGAKGAVLSWEGLVLRFGGTEVLEVDSTGAGDAFDGAFLATLALGGTPADALQAACAAGARVAGSPEAWPS